MTKTLQRRTIRTPIQCRGGDDAQSPRQIFGYAAMFGVPSQDLGGFVEMLAPGCFEKTLKGGDPRCFFNHNYDLLLGRASSGTLRLWEDETGLAFEVDVDDTTDGLNTWKRVKRRDVDGNSFGFYPLRDEWSEDGQVNTVLEAELIEVSPVVFPAYPQTVAEARSYLNEPFDPERLARRPRQRFHRLERARRIMIATED